ncbi:ATP-binding protein [Paroceanicella profunda]|uniref:ATP-binding protein n=1 Tax=Paroceanicella profunda TaxID=2579971 RepID=UPI0014796777|nr:winged helix-turn-helix domain-containing protein [Paroceanicella profunda]
MFAFGPFRLDTARRQLLCDARECPLGARALDLLLALLEAPGELVSKNRLFDAAWPDTVVDESNLRAQVALLRKALGDGRDGARYIVAVPGRGYRFVAPVERRESRHEPPRARRAPHARPSAGLPASAPRLPRPIGRDDIIDGLAGRLRRTRFVTIVGPGGIGKTTVALAVAAELAGEYRDGVCFLDLAPLAAPGLLPSALAAALSLPGITDDPTPAILEELRGREMLVVLDCCEHVIEPAALLAERLLRQAPRVHVLATSREPLRAEGEGVHRLPPLDAPPLLPDLTAAEALSYPAVQLFAERAAACVEGFVLTDAEAEAAGHICRKLDGLALAIELAAARVDALGVRGLAERLDDRFAVLTQGRRTARSRHRTLGAVLDWSFDLLPAAERLLLNRLSVFRGGFSMDAAVAVAGDGEGDGALSGMEVCQGLANLVSKSLIVAMMTEGAAEYRLPDSTRIYARAKLAATQDGDRLAERHARHLVTLLGGGPASATARAAHLDDVRAALEWSFGPGGDSALAATLAAAAIPLWMSLSLVDECRRCVSRALECEDTRADPRLHMTLCAAYGLSLIYTRGPGAETGEALSQALLRARELQDSDQQLRVLWGLGAFHGSQGAFPAALHHAQAFLAAAVTPADRLVGDRMIGTVQHFLGAQETARPALERLLHGGEAPAGGTDMIRFQYDQRVTASATLSWVCWILGAPDTARQHSHDALQRATAADHLNSRVYALVESCCPMALLTGDTAALANAVEALNAPERAGPVPVWRLTGDLYRGLLALRRGLYRQGVDMLSEALETRRSLGFTARHDFFRGCLAEALARMGEIDRARAEIDAALAGAARQSEAWCRPELLRLKGEILLVGGAEAEAREAWHAGLDLARRDSALGWELRLATSLARLLQTRGRPVEARALLAPVFARFHEGNDTADLRAARHLLSGRN